jgi:hypothetical protein
MPSHISITGLPNPTQEEHVAADNLGSEIPDGNTIHGLHLLSAFAYLQLFRHIIRIHVNDPPLANLPF